MAQEPNILPGFGFDLNEPIVIDQNFDITISVEMADQSGFGNALLEPVIIDQDFNTVEPSEKIELVEGWENIDTDSEYIPQLDKPTIPLTVQFHSNGNNREYLHPNHPLSDDDVQYVWKVLNDAGESNALHVAECPFLVLDYLYDTYGIEVRHAPDPNVRARVKVLNIHIFFSIKDIEFLFSDRDVYEKFILPKLDRKRRLTTAYNRPIPLPYEIYIPDKRGQMKWHSVSMKIVDISAMQGGKSLSTYLQNVGFDTTDKDTYVGDEKSRMDLRLVENPLRFLNYIRADVKLKSIKDKTNNFYNQIAQLIGIEPREEWGMSTGIIVASMASEWMAKKAGVPVEDIEASEENKAVAGFYQYNRLATPEAIKQLSHVSGNKNLLYLGMTDGGRCIKERPHIDTLIGFLYDLDIDGCYGNGLLNQTFAVGNPKIIFSQMTFGQWEKKFVSRLRPGLWTARMSWKNAPFRQDLFISKEEKQFTAWDFYQRQFCDDTASDDNKQYDASMYLTTNDVTHTILQHDFYQVLKHYASNEELGWIRKNAVIECFAFYPNNEEIDVLDEDLLIVRDWDKYKWSGLKWKSLWKSVPLKELLEILLNRRAIHKKMMGLYEARYKPQNEKKLDSKKIPTEKIHFKVDEAPSALQNYWKILQQTLSDWEYYTFNLVDYQFHQSTQEFLKLIINTIYGCIASTYFGTNGTGISNYIIGNNITARARVLTWCMAKGLHTLMSITDGGVGDINKALSYRRTSLDIFANVADDKFVNSQRHKVVDVVPLYGRQIPVDENMGVLIKGVEGYAPIAVQCWNHLKCIFGKLDLFAKDQFKFEVKSVYTSCEIRNKSDYRLINSFSKGKPTIALRGMNRKSGDIANEIFDDIKNNTPQKHTQHGKGLLGLTEWRQRENLRAELLPHDEVSKTKEFYSVTPLGMRFINAAHRKTILSAYDRLKIKSNPVEIAHLRALESLTDWEGYKKSTKRSAKKNDN